MTKKLDKKRNRKVDGGLYVGIGGIAYMLWFVSEKIAEFNFLDTADQFAQLHLKFCQQNASNDLGSKLGFYLGNTGVYAINAVIAKSLGNAQLSKQYVKHFAAAEEFYLTADPMGVGSDELFIGRAGYLTGKVK